MDLEDSLLHLEGLFLAQLKISTHQNQESQDRELSIFQSTSSSRQHKSMEIESHPTSPQHYSIFNDKFEVLDPLVCSSLLSRLQKVTTNYVSPNEVSSRFVRHKENQKKIFQKRMEDLDKILSQKIEIPLDFKHLDIGNERLTRSDLQNLRPPKYLNGQCISFYLKLVIENIIDEQTRKDTFLYNTYFMTKLLGDYITNQKKLESIKEVIPKEFIKQIKGNAEKLLRWTKNTNIFQKRILVFPINLPMHWISIIVVNLPYLMGDGSVPLSIIYMDSMGRKNKSLIEAIRVYLQLELENKEIYQKNKVVITKDNLPDYQLMLPRQANFHDCGPCTLLNVQCLLLNPRLLFRDFSSISCRKQFIALYPKSLIFTMRQRMINLFLKLYSSQDNKQLKDFFIKQYMRNRQELINNVDQNDFDMIDGKEFKKFLAMKKYEIQNQEQQYSKLLEFYLDPQYNYFQNK